MLLKLLFKLFVNKPGTYIDIVLVRLTGWSLITALVCKTQQRRYQPSMVFRTIGAKSGKIRTCVLPYQRDGERYYVVGSNGGSKRDPAWANNMRRNPSCWLYVNRKKIPARGYVADGEERERIWQRLVDGGARLYVQYQKMADPRTLPIVILEPLE